MVDDPDVLVVGAGPTGLAHALWLTRQGVRVRIIDRSAGPGETSRAMTVQARTLELYRQVGLSDEVVAAGHRIPAMNLWAHGRHRARLVMAEAGAGVTPYPFILVYPQDQHERLLVARLADLGVRVERQTGFLSFEEGADHVRARLQRPDGSEELCTSDYLAGCDGAHSPIRQQIGTGFGGGTYRHVFYVADVRLSGLDPADDGHLAFDRSDFVVVLPYGPSGMCRLIGTVTDGDPDTLSFADIGHRAIEGLGIRIEAVNWFSTYRVHHRVTDHFRQGRVFLLGDAAHVHSPVGGQGMNTGIGDAVNLAWKLATVLAGKATDALLDTYDQERRAFARKLVETTDRVFSFVTAEGDFADFVRTRIAPLVASVAYRVDGVSEMMFRLVSQTTLNYRESALSSGRAGQTEGGDRLPWVSLDGVDNFETLEQIAWQVHVYGSAGPDLQAWARQRGIPVHRFDWDARYADAGLARDAAYVLRPDGHVGWAGPQAPLEGLEAYFKDRRIDPSRPAAAAR